MKKYLLIMMLLNMPFLIFGQILLETLDGDEITLNPKGIKNNTIIGNLSSSEESLQFRTIFTLPNKKGILPISFFTLGLKGKPSDGIFTLFSDGNFNLSTNINLSYTKVHLFFYQNSKVTDFFSIKSEYNVNELTLLKPDNIFDNQIDKFNFHGGGVFFNYNVLVSGKDLFAFSIGYSYKNNYSKLKPIEIRDYKITNDTISGISREYGKVINGREGSYKEFESFPVNVSYTYCPSESKEDEDKLKFGFSIYYASEFGKFKPSHNLGTLLFLTKQNQESGVRIPIIGIGIQANDITDNANKGNTLTKRISVNLTTTFKITGF